MPARSTANRSIAPFARLIQASMFWLGTDWICPICVTMGNVHHSCCWRCSGLFSPISDWPVAASVRLSVATWPYHIATAADHFSAIMINRVGSWPGYRRLLQIITLCMYIDSACCKQEPETIALDQLRMCSTIQSSVLILGSSITCWNYNFLLASPTLQTSTNRPFPGKVGCRIHLTSLSGWNFVCNKRCGNHSLHIDSWTIV